MENAQQYRERADAERSAADVATLDNVRDRALRSAQRWDELATRAEQVQTGAAARAAAKVAVTV